MADDYYKELGITSKATPEEIKKAYKKAASKWHPDRNANNPDAEAKFKAINEANDVLSDPQKRARYDQFGHAGARGSVPPNWGGGGGSPFGGRGFNVEDIFGGGGGGGGIGDMFGDMFGNRKRPTRGSDVTSTVHVDFATAIAGTEIEIRVPGQDAPVKVRIPPGANEGDKLRVAGRGAPGRNGAPPGDLLLSVAVSTHPFFKREGLDLSLEIPVSLTEAIRGAKIRVPTPTGDVNMSLPPHSPAGKRLRLAGRGVKRGQQVGDLYVSFVIQAPSDSAGLSDKELELIHEATDLSARDDKRLKL